MPTHTKQAGGRRGVIAAAVTALLAVTAAVFVVVGLLGGQDGPPKPPASASKQEPVTSTPSQSKAKQHEHDQPAEKKASRDVDHSVRTLPQSKPAELTIPAIDVHASEFMPLGRQPNGKIEVPEQNDTVGWYEGGPTPGEFGPAVLGGHVDSDAGPAIFYSLGELRPGDKARVRRADGKTAVFTIYAVEQYPKDQLPTQKVYAPQKNRPELRLITCGGTFDEEVQHYRSNIVAYATMTAVK